MLLQAFGSYRFRVYSVLKDSGVVLHDIVHANYMKLLSIYQSSQFNTQL